MNEMSDLLEGDTPAPALETSVSTDTGNDIKPPAAAKPPAQPSPNTPPAAEATDPATPPAADAATAGEPGALPEGVRERTIDGKKSWVVDPEVGKATVARAALIEEAEKLWGEPVTAESIKFRQEMAEGFELMRSDMISDNPADQAKVIDHLTGVIEQAAKAGEIGHDALSSFFNMTIDKALNGAGPLADSVLSHISERLLGMQELPTAILDKVAGNQQVLKQVISSAYLAALTEKDPAVATALWHSAQQIEKNKFGTFRTVKEMDFLRTTGATTLPSYQRAEAAKPAQAQPAAAQPQQQNAATPSPEAAQAYKEWGDTTDRKIHQEAVLKNVDTVLDQAIDKDLKEKYPNYAKSAKAQLVAAVQEGLKNDSQLRSQIAAIERRARLAVSPEIRNQLQSMVIKQYAQRAAQILSEKKGPILSEFATLLKAQSTQDTRRADASQRAGRQAAPAGGPSAARQTVPRAASGKFTSATDFANELDTALA